MPLNIEFWWNKKKWPRMLKKENINLKGWNSTSEWRLIKGNACAISFFSGHETAIITTATAHSLTDGPFTLPCIVSLNMSDDMWRWWMNSVSFCQTSVQVQVNGCPKIASRHAFDRQHRPSYSCLFYPNIYHKMMIIHTNIKINPKREER